ncbi:hypothetical protein EDB85DRAFT_603123 [Lactarius pseudohatsudake]|nr:hypothetical protein EDB85DRAFT_603123 [Lactarius pseudohatsudake]
MLSRVSSSLSVLTSIFLLSAGDLVVARIDSPICTDTVLSWEWSFNSLNQNPCLVSAHLMAKCYGSVFTLLVVGDSYSSPTKEQVQEVNSCSCSTVILSLISTRGECQEGLSKSWTQCFRKIAQE